MVSGVRVYAKDCAEIEYAKCEQAALCLNASQMAAMVLVM